MFSGQMLVVGCSVALCLLQLLMITPLGEYFFYLPPEVRTPAIYVCDGSVYVIGRKGTVEDITVVPAKKLCKVFEDGAVLPVSKTKRRVTASCAKFAKAIAQRLRKVWCKATKVLATLGLDAVAGRGGLRGHPRVRLGVMQKRSLRLRRLNGVGTNISNVAQAAVLPGVSHGARVTAMTPAVLHSLRRTMTIATGPSKIGFNDVAVHGGKLTRDPTYDACGAPMRFWSRQALQDQD